MNTRQTPRHTQKGHFAVAFVLALAINSAVGIALVHTPTQGQRYLAAAASASAQGVDLAAANCAKSRV